ncbi:polymorphic toxin-type HINT domain-containing protein [Dactylosporangium sp. McL0621]|uniref:polymorphic toxin-type HINT domain-containing protein n=1 Tax=Dactylosporangium sp. McL0621 TaxID=3415678 RepID=UPI003CF3267C
MKRTTGRVLTLALPVLLVVSLGGQAPAFAAPAKPFSPAAAAKVPSVRTKAVPAGKPVKDTTKKAQDSPAPVWPGASAADVDVAAASGGPVSVTAPTTTARARTIGAASVPIPARAHVEVLDQQAAKKANVQGLLFKVGRGDGGSDAAGVGVKVDYSKFATAYGADWSTRLKLVELPACAQSTPERAECRGTDVPSHNDSKTKTVSADVVLGATAKTLALTAGSSGASGSYGATSLSSSSTWSAGGSAGDFSWSFPMRTPPSLGGPSPTLQITYSAQSVDGRMVTSNNQPSIVGEGFELSTSGYIERRYKTCAEDPKTGGNAAAKTGDMCWATDNATMSLNGSGSELIKDGTDPNKWHPRNDDGSRVEHKLGAANGDNDGEWWVVTTVNGTQYWFGRNQLPGAPAGTATQSTWTEPVFGNDAGEPCHGATFAASSCTQAYRWNLDFVVDPHGNTMSYWYGVDRNFYSKNNGTATQYDRGGYLDHVVYGTRDENLATAGDWTTGTDTVFSGHPAARINYGYADRCLSSCGTKDKAHWPDTPWDLNCDSGATCPQTSPSFWTTRRLASITTQVWEVSTSAMRDTERWTLMHTFPDPEDGTRAGLWLDKVGHSGLVGGQTDLPDVSFVPTQMPNRVDGVDASPSMNWSRLTAINTETGGQIQIVYLGKDCVVGSRMPASPENNTLRCYPVRWTPDPITGEVTDYFHKYVVDKVIENDLTGGSKRVLHQYTYLGDPAWHYADDDGLISSDQKTWNVWRGYAKVGTSAGEAPTAPGNPDERTYSETLYFRGMNGDHLPSGTRSVNVVDSEGGSVPDDDAYSGMIRESRTFNGVGGPEVSGAINDPWQSAATATRTINGVTTTAKFINTSAVHSRTTLDAGRGVRRSSTKNTFDSLGMVVTATDYGDDAVTGDEQCTTTSFEPRNTSVWLMTAQQRTQTFSVDCDKVAAGPITEADVIGDSRLYYDNATTFGTAPTKGDVTKSEALSVWSATNPTYYQLSRSTYDVLGRVTESWDAMDYHSQTDYTPATTGPVTQTVDTNPRSWQTTTNLEPAWGLTTSTVDQNGRRTETTYDGLGRLTGVWLPDRSKAAGATANMTYEYLIRKDGANAVTSRRLNPSGGYTTSYALYDGLVRERQTQTDSPSGGRLLTDVFYDTAGRRSRSFAAYHDASGAPGTSIVAPVDEGLTIPSQTRLLYDGAGREVAQIFQPYNSERWRTETYYGGDYTAVTPPLGGTGSLTRTDENGRTTELWQFASRIPGNLNSDPSTYDKTTYSYNRRGLLAKVVDPAGYEWTYDYDLRGRNTSSKDPDSGTTTKEYDNAGRMTKTTDSRGNVLVTTYDNLNRQTGLYQNSVTAANQLAGWTYDTTKFEDGVTNAKGNPTASIRYVSGQQYKSTVVQYNDRYQATVSTVTIPASETGLAGDYTYYTGYNADGTVTSTSSPGVGDLQPETMAVGYNALGMTDNLSSFYGADQRRWLVERTSFNALAQPTQYSLFNGTVTTDDNDSGGPRTYLSRSYELETGRLTGLKTDRDQVSPNTVADLHYSYNDFGTIGKIADTPAGGTADTQCFTHDRYERLTDAWTPASGDCATGPTATTGGPAPYRVHYDYDTVGRRTGQTQYGTAAGTRSTTYGYPVGATPATTTRPHTMTGTSTTDDTGIHTASYSYDNAGNTIGRPGTNGNQTLQWDAEGNLTSVTDTAGSTTFLYGADGNRLIRKDVTGKTLYLPDMEVKYNTQTAAKTCTRYYSFGGTIVGQRTAGGITWLASDGQGTADVSILATTQAVTVRRQQPFGEQRGASVTWPNEKGFVGGTNDPTGLVQIGARYYDAAIGRFISTDPVLDNTDPQQLQGYAYSENSPVTHSDPTGERTDEQYYGKSGAANMDRPFDQAQWDRDAQAELDRQKRAKEAQQKAYCKAHPIKCGWQKAKTATVNWVDEHKAEIIGNIAGFAVGLGCGALIGVTGVGAVACGALAGAVTNMVTYAIQTKVEHKGNFSWGGMLKTGAEGAIIGGVMGGLGAVAGPALKAGKAALMGGGGLKAAVSAGGKAAAAESRAMAQGAKNMVKGGAAPKAAAPRRGCSFTAGTRVLMADGSRRPIQDVRPGDTVSATDPRTGNTVPRKVVAVYVNRDNALTDLTVRSVDGSIATVRTSQNHPFWDSERQAWVGAGDLRPGATLNDGSAVAPTVVRVSSYVGARDMYDLTVDDVHTYYVGAGETPVLVHNCGDADEWQIEDHVMPRHVAGGAENAGKATFGPQFSSKEALLNLASMSKRYIGRTQAATGRARWVIDTGIEIGKNADGSPTTVLTIVRQATNEWDFGDLVTMHPGLPRDLIRPFAH